MRSGIFHPQNDSLESLHKTPKQHINNAGFLRLKRKERYVINPRPEVSLGKQNSGTWRKGAGESSDSIMVPERQPPQDPSSAQISKSPGAAHSVRTELCFQGRLGLT